MANTYDGSYPKRADLAGNARAFELDKKLEREVHAIFCQNGPHTSDEWEAECDRHYSRLDEIYNEFWTIRNRILETHSETP